MSQNAADIEQLALRIQTMSSTLQKSHSQGKLSPSINYLSRSFPMLQPVTRLNLLYRAWNDDIEQLHQLAATL